MHPDPMLDEETAWDRAVAAHEATLVVGAQVRITLSPECEYCEDDGGDGQAGVIVATTLPTKEDGFDYEHETDPTILAHHYRVRYGDMEPGNWSGYTAAELLVPRAADPDEDGTR